MLASTKNQADLYKQMTEVSTPRSRSGSVAGSVAGSRSGSAGSRTPGTRTPKMRPMSGRSESERGGAGAQPRSAVIDEVLTTPPPGFGVMNAMETPPPSTFEGTATPQPRDGVSEAGTPQPLNGELAA